MYQITLEIQKLEEGPYLGTSPELPGLIVQGATPEEVVELAPDIARELIEVMLETAVNRSAVIPNHPGDIPTGTLRAILRQLGIQREDFDSR